MLESAGFWRWIALGTWLWACLEAWDAHAHGASAPTQYMRWLFLAPLLLGVHMRTKSTTMQVRIFAACIGFAFADEIVLFTAPRQSPLTIGLGCVWALIHLWMTVVLLSIPQSVLSRERRNG